MPEIPAYLSHVRPAASSQPATSLVARARVVPAWGWLAAIVALSALVRGILAVTRSTPRYFPDEYIYTSLARSIGHGEISIRGETVHFPALLEPLVDAPLWLLQSTETAYRLTQALHAVEMSLVALPVYLLARRLGLPTWQALASAAAAVTLPALVFSSYATADSLGFTLATAAVAVGVTALDRPTRRSQALFLAAAGLATFARVQYVVILAAFLAATLIVSNGRLREALHAFGATYLFVGIPAVLAVVVVGPSGALGYYSGILEFSLDPASAVRWVAVDAMLFAYAVGWALVPGAVVGLGAGLARPHDRTERAFAAMTVLVGFGLLAEAALYATNGSPRFQERYLIGLMPLAPIAFSIGARRLAHVRYVVVAIATGLAVLSMRVPLSGYAAASGKQDSPFLSGVFQIEQWVGTGEGSLIVALSALALAGLATVGALRPRVGTPAVLIASIATSATIAIASTLNDIQSSDTVRRLFVPASPSWVDEAALGKADVLLAPGSFAPVVSEHLFWNRSLDRVVLLPGAQPIDAFGTAQANIDSATGALLEEGAPMGRPLLVEEYYSVVEIEDAPLIVRAKASTLWGSSPHPHIALIQEGRYLDGWLGRGSAITIWPGADGSRRATLRLRLRLPDEAPSMTLTVAAPAETQTVAVLPGRSVTVDVPVRATRAPVTVTITSGRAWIRGNRAVSVLAERPQLITRQP